MRFSGHRLGAFVLAGWLPLAAQANPAAIDWVRIGEFEIARTETTVAQFRAFVQATGLRTAAERAGGGEAYELGWVRKPGWTWSSPYGPGHRAADREPAVHVTWHEAKAFCEWAGARLPSDEEWAVAAYVEQRRDPPPPFQRGRRYAYPTGDSPIGAQCLDDCGPGTRERAVPHGVPLNRGHGHALAGRTPPGVNGLHDMGGNVWEWVDDPPAGDDTLERRTRGGSWWYGAGPMRIASRQTKPPGTAVVYIGFRCAR
jgi:formylglycine-generating enzyme